MGNSQVFRIHNGQDAQAAYAMTRRLQAAGDHECRCPKTVSASVETSSHQDLGRYLRLESPSIGLSIPAAVVTEVLDGLRPHLARRDNPIRHKNGNAFLITDLTPAVIATLVRLPLVPVTVQAPESPLGAGLAEAVLAVMDDDPATIDWDLGWPFNHSDCGFQLGLNSAERWVPLPPSGHSVYVHVSTAEEAAVLAVTVGGRILGPGAGGW